MFSFPLLRTQGIGALSATPLKHLNLGRNQLKSLPSELSKVRPRVSNMYHTASEWCGCLLFLFLLCAAWCHTYLELSCCTSIQGCSFCQGKSKDADGRARMWSSAFLTHEASRVLV